MIEHFGVIAIIVFFAGGSVAWEWPRYCHGWSFPEVQALFCSLPFGKVLVDGCATGLVGNEGLPLLKPRTVYSTCVE